MAGKAHGPADGPKKIFGAENINWSGPKPASIMGVSGDLTSVINDFSSETGELISDAAEHVYETVSAAMENYWDRYDIDEVSDEFVNRRKPSWMYEESHRDHYRSSVRSAIEDTDIPNQVEVQAVEEIEDADPGDWERPLGSNGFMNNPRATDKYYNLDFNDDDISARLSVIAAQADKGSDDHKEVPKNMVELHKRILSITDMEDSMMSAGVAYRGSRSNRYTTGSVDRTVSDHYTGRVDLNTACELATITDDELETVSRTHGLDPDTLRTTINNGLYTKARGQVGRDLDEIKDRIMVSDFSWDQSTRPDEIMEKVVSQANFNELNRKLGN